jgi:hypothetical protein
MTPQETAEPGRRAGTVDVEVALQNLRASLLGEHAAPVAPAGGSDIAPERLAALISLDDKVHATYLGLRERLLFGPEAMVVLSPSLVAKSRRIFAEIATLFADCAHQFTTQGNALAYAPMLAARTFRSATEHLKWTTFEHTAPAGSFWLGLHSLYRSVDALGGADQAVDLYAGPTSARTTCTDAYMQCLLLGTLNVGVLAPMSIEIAHRWLVDMARNQQLSTIAAPKVHTHRVRFDAAQGAVRITEMAVPDDATRFIACGSLEPGLAETRKYLYSGALTAQARNPSAAALHYGAFLDLAERLWSPEWQRVLQRAPREAVRGVSIEAVLGLDRIVAALDAATHEEPVAAAPAALEIDWPDQREGTAASNVINLPGRSSARWTLRDRSETGLAALVPHAAAAALPVGALIGLREGDGADWGLGMLVRRIAAAESGESLLGIKRLSANPVHVSLILGAGDGKAQREIDALFAPMQTKHARIDALIVPDTAFTATADCSLRVGNDLYQIRLDRILDRGDDWMRVGFEIVGKAPSS